ncbi:MAG: c-type cytochrome domain-containing protein, partial [Roseibacillus sp.]|nr:c-type cytochrome domain-containing protein [Roseibacillus sp.]
MRSLTLITPISLSALGFQTAMAAEEVAADMLFARKVLPLFKQRCIACHGEDPKKKLKGEFDMRTRADLLKGGESEEPSLVPGKPLQSPLYLASTRAHEDDWEPMPPKENDKLSAKEIAYVRDWIAGGAPWPDAQRITVLLEQEDPWATEDGVLVKTSGGLSREWTNRKY